MKNKVIISLPALLAACAPQAPAPIINGYTNTPMAPVITAKPKPYTPISTEAAAPASTPATTATAANNSITAEPLAVTTPQPQPQPKAVAATVPATTVTHTAAAKPGTALEEVRQTINPQSQPEILATEPALQPESPSYTMHKVEPKETIYRISRTYNASIIDIMAANDFEKPQDLKAGTIVRVPVAAPVAAVAKAEPQPRQTPPAVANVADTEPAAGNPPLSSQMAESSAETGVQVASRELPAGISLKTESAAVKTQTALAEAKRGYVDKTAANSKGLAWPVKGDIIRRFGQNADGIAYTGINIAVPEGTPVLASEGGKVLYADDGLKIYGKLVLIRHDNGMVSAYAHNGYLLVKKGESVKKGQVIAMSGASGNVEQPQLHFELRQHASAIDPLRVLPKI